MTINRHTGHKGISGQNTTFEGVHELEHSLFEVVEVLRCIFGNLLISRKECDQHKQYVGQVISLLAKGYLEDVDGDRISQVQVVARQV